MRRFFARRALDRFGARYDYDVGYMHHMLQTSPSALLGFAGLTKLARHRKAAPVQAFYAAKLVGALTEDCGPCTQLAARMAEEAGVPAASIQAVLTRNRAAMNGDTFLGFRFADALARRLPDLDGARDAVRARWGEMGVLDLTLAVQIGRVFPMVKAGLGFAEACEGVQIAGRLVMPTKAHAPREAA